MPNVPLLHLPAQDPTAPELALNVPLAHKSHVLLGVRYRPAGHPEDAATQTLLFMIMPAAAQSALETGHIAVVSSLAAVQQQKRLRELTDAPHVDGVVPDLE